jgi:hypothetical protein
MKKEDFVGSWVSMFEAVGVREDGRRRWHAEFEARFPERHASFLAWLGLDGGRIAEIRAESRAAREG